MGKETCAVITCGKTKGDGVSLHVLPSNNEEAKGWANFLQRVNASFIWKPQSKKLYICSKHFRKCCILESLCKRRLKMGHIPSIINGKIVYNPTSKCLPLSPLEKTMLYSQSSLYSDKMEYLRDKLRSFSVSKIVIGRNPITINKAITTTTNIQLSPDTCAVQSVSNSNSSIEKNLPLPPNHKSLGIATQSESASDLLMSNPVFSIKFDAATAPTATQVSSGSNGTTPVGKSSTFVKHYPDRTKAGESLHFQNRSLRRTVTTLEKKMSEMKRDVKYLMGRVQFLNGNLRDVNTKYNRLKRQFTFIPKSSAEVIDISD